MIVPFVSKDVILIKVVKEPQDIADFEVLSHVYINFDTGILWVVVIRWDKKIIKSVGPFTEGQVEEVVRSIVNSYGSDLRQAIGDPKKEVVVQLFK